MQRQRISVNLLGKKCLLVQNRSQKQAANTQYAYSMAGTSNSTILGIPLGLCVRSLCLVLFVCAFTIKLESVPPVWWDEGWTLSVARNWVEQGHYGRLLNGQPTPAGFEAAFPITALVALSFRALGYGIYQARLVSVLLMIGTLSLLFYLARCLYNRSVARITLASSVLIPAFQDLHPVFIGRQVLGEGPALLCLLASYICLLAGAQKKIWMTIVAGVLAALAISVKAQVLPFWVLSMLIPILSMLHAKRWRCAGLFGVTLTSGFLTLPTLIWLWRYVLQQPSFARTVPGLYEVTAMVTSIPSRLFAVIVLVLFGLPALFGTGYSIWKILIQSKSLDTHRDCVRLSLLVLVSTWLAWYIVASVGWTRYLFPASFLANVFLAAMFHDLTNGFNRVPTGKGFSTEFKQFRFARPYSMTLLIALLLVCVSVPRTVRMFYRTYVTDADSSVQKAAEYLNTMTPPGSVIETYDAELFFLLKRPYHYPPDELNVKLVRRTFLYAETSIDYDPLLSNPDYLVIGPHSKQFHLYDPLLKTGQFRLVRVFKRYEIYQRR
jgi:hypothetical protein